MATRLATTRNFITVTSVTNDENDANGSSSNANNSNNSEVRTTQITPVSLHHVNLGQVSDKRDLSQKKSILRKKEHGCKQIYFFFCSPHHYRKKLSFKRANLVV